MPKITQLGSIFDRPPPRFFTAWSFSRWSDHSDPVTGCPRRARLKHLDKLPEGKPGPALARGAAIDAKATKYLQHPKTKLPSELKLFAAQFAHLRKMGAQAQAKWAFDVNWQPVDFMDWDRAWVRVVLDSHHQVGHTSKVIDFKTGKVYEKNEKQLELYAPAALTMYPKATETDAALWYLDNGVISEETYPRKDLAKLQKLWRGRVKPLLLDRKFPPRPSEEACRFCPWSKRKGGPCEFGS